MVMVVSRILDWDDRGWRDRAACRDSDPDLFFPIGSTGAAVEEIRAAKAICQTCAVREECLAFALETNQEAGVWGGTSEEERRALRRERATTRRRTLVLR
jgi:WhiB family redox-sensing transcriptional regulator